VKIEQRCLTENIHVGLPVGFECADIPPIVRFLVGLQSGNVVVAKVVRQNAMRADGAGQNIATEVMRARCLGIVFEDVLEKPGIEEIISHRGKRLPWIAGHRLGVLWFFLESDDVGRALFLVYFDDAESLRGMYGHGPGRDGDVGVMVQVKLHHLVDVHAVDVICPEHGDEIRLKVTQQIHVLIHGVGGSFVPPASGPHLRRDHRHKLVRLPFPNPPGAPQVLDQ
jgi:hypothetical protein